jgi:hypothetical protein
MSIPVASEKKLLAPEEFEVVKATHHPAISELTLEALRSAKDDLGERREKLRARLVESRRARMRRTARETPQGAGEPAVARRKQVFAKALRRVNHELHRREEAKARPVAVGPRPGPKLGKAAPTPKAAASASKDVSAVKTSRGRVAKGQPSEAKGEAKGRKASKKEG